MAARRKQVKRQRKKQLTQRYEVNMEFQAWDLAKAGSALTIEVREHQELLGTIEIGQGSFRWKAAHGKLGFKRIPWRSLAKGLDQM